MQTITYQGSPLEVSDYDAYRLILGATDEQAEEMVARLKLARLEKMQRDFIEAGRLPLSAANLKQDDNQ